jgi:uncharacterized Zn-binding protein involved in type VI secretion
MPQVARIGDIAVGTCRAHKSPVGCAGPVVSGSPTLDIDGRPCARIGDVVAFNCGHSGIVVSGSPTTDVDGRRMARIGDLVVGPMTAVICSGSGTTSCD